MAFCRFLRIGGLSFSCRHAGEDTGPTFIAPTVASVIRRGKRKSSNGNIAALFQISLDVCVECDIYVQSIHRRD